jgi:hypothetical protein
MSRFGCIPEWVVFQKAGFLRWFASSCLHALEVLSVGYLGPIDPEAAQGHDVYRLFLLSALQAAHHVLAAGDEGHCHPISGAGPGVAQDRCGYLRERNELGTHRRARPRESDGHKHANDKDDPPPARHVR